MPNKKRRQVKAAASSGEKEDNRIPGKSSFNDTPYAFRMAMKMVENGPRKRKRPEPTKPALATHSEIIMSKNLKIEKGESLSQFEKRVDVVAEITQAEVKVFDTKKAQKRLAHFEKLKEKKKSKKKPSGDIAEPKDFHHLTDKVKFNEVAEAPPIFQKLPRPMRKTIMPGETKPTLVKPRSATKVEPLLLESQLRPGEQEVADAKAKAKAKLKDMTMGQKRILEEERTRVIANYRMRKVAAYESHNQARGAADPSDTALLDDGL
ncbi:hypothetical protein H4R33_004914 [Dimargaris cristalligena]|uniref:Uncharacterized protein n=1 Tax=Dimargaris cristalligena TaxID=215637 RepID=A0A4P9ZXL2_9FUNG|nr:hypothetical protein H4R33_004914 [Dimargaris cristalligena]RKP37470.1 hypothetical protein BJ085DRAFT_30450 [Dimargaris cristalligena]|eukprot:RKP37470.1 hypothetical protein BJ085DRAFT_30450 [Dimargaris cristalligena]